MRSGFDPSRRRFARASALAGAALAAPVAPAATNGAPPAIAVKSYAQELVDRIVAQHPDVSSVVMHVSPAKGSPNVVIASNIGQIGAPADDGDREVIATGRPRVEMDRSRKRIVVEVALLDIHGDVIGALELSWRRPPGAGSDDFVHTAHAMRDALSRRILSIANLMEPFPYERLATTRSRAQTIVDEALRRHPELVLLALRGRTWDGDLVLLGSTFGRHGKRADLDDLKVAGSPGPVAALSSKGKRLDVGMALRGRGGSTVGTMTVGYAVKPGTDLKGLQRQAMALRDELEAEVTATPDLGALDA